MIQPARTRFAPSPTGYMHVGGVRTALFAWLLARQTGGQFILRLEDTDKKREVEGSADHLIHSLKSLGLTYDEGPDIGGPYAPYRQSDRLDIYHKWAQKLIDSGRAYADPYTAEELDAFRKKATAEKRPFLYRDHRPENPPAWDGTTALRFKSEPKAYAWHDEVMGDLSTGPEVVDDFILIKSDGYPTYNFAHIVDDTEMGVTHVIRGQEFISSQPNYLNLYEALGFDMTAATPLADKFSETSASPIEPDGGSRGIGREAVSENFVSDEASTLSLPVFATMPHIMAPTGNKKLGKRDGAKDALEYLEDGILPEALINFIASLGWNDGTEQEIFSVDELIEKFSLGRVQRSGARFDERRLIWMNGQWIRQISLDDLYSRVETMWPESAHTASEEYKKLVLSLVQDRLHTLKDLPMLTDYFFHDPKPNWGMTKENKQLKKLETSQAIDLLGQTIKALEQSDFSSESIQQTLNQLLETTGQKPGTLFSLIRLAVSWAPFSPALPETLATLGKDRTLKRLKAALEATE